MNLKAAAVFSDRMVLQREKPVAVFGTAQPGTEVCVKIQGAQGTGKADADGKWIVTLPALHTSVSETMEIRSGEETIEIHEVMVGEVWLAGGQSNMEFQMRYDRDFEAEQKICDNPMIRIFDVPKIFAPEYAKRFDFLNFGYWRTVDAENLQYFSAAGYYFAQVLSAQLQVPVGIVGCNVGGTRTCCWVDEETVEVCGPQWVREYEEGIRAAENLEEAKEAYIRTMMVNPSDPFANSFADRMMKGLIGLWRRRWDEELPFLMTQLAPMGPGIGPDEDGFGPIRKLQEELTKLLPGVWTASTSDCGHPYDIHPKVKRPVGRRLALLALAHVYGAPVLADAPVPEKARKDGGRIVIDFLHADGGLALLGDKVEALQIFDGSRELAEGTDFTVKIDGSSMRIEGTDGSDVHADRIVFAGQQYYQVNLYNRAMIPAKPFEAVIA